MWIQRILGLGLKPEELDLGQVLLRTAIVFTVALVIIRIAGRRFLAGRNPFDVLLAFILGSMLSRAINGSAPFFETLGAGVVVVGLHRGLSYGACKLHWLGVLLKGRAEKLIVEGRTDRRVMSRHHVSQHDLEEDLRLEGAVEDAALVRVAHLERNGRISVQRKPQVAEIAVAKGVQTVRVMIEG